MDSGEVQFTQLAQSGDADNGLASLPNPCLHWQLAMIALRQNVRQPYRRYPAPTQPFLLSVASQVPIMISGSPICCIVASSSGKSSMRSVVMLSSGVMS